MSGWVKLHRKITEWQWYNKSEFVHLFMHIVVTANHKKAMWQGHEIEKGELITSIDKLRVATGISAQSIRTILKKLENTGEIEIKSTNQWTKITVCKYDSYQSNEEEINEPTNKRLTNGQQTANKRLTTNKNNKELKEEEEIYATADHLVLTVQQYDKLIEDGYTVAMIEKNIQAIQNYNGIKKYKSFNMTLRNWMQSDLEKHKAAQPKQPQKGYWLLQEIAQDGSICQQQEFKEQREAESSMRALTDAFEKQGRKWQVVFDENHRSRLEGMKF